MVRNQLVWKVALLVPFLLNFRLISSFFSWDVSVDQPTLYLKFGDDFMNHSLDDHELPGVTELESIDADQRVAAIVAMVIADYNAVETSYLQLALHNDNLEEEDPDQESENRTINIDKAGTGSALTAGFAKPEYEDESIVDCTIVIGNVVMESAKDLKATLTHEIGHCLGLDHSHEDRDAIMSYNASQSLHELGVDDKMGITFLYPLEPEYAEESATLGLSCSRR